MFNAVISHPEMAAQFLMRSGFLPHQLEDADQSVVVDPVVVVAAAAAAPPSGNEFIGQEHRPGPGSPKPSWCCCGRCR